MLIAQISDFHLVAPGQRAYGRVDTAAMLSHAVAVLNRLDPQPDLVVATGDLVQSGRTEDYAALADILAGLRAPFLPVAGNHDDRDGLRRVFPRRGMSFGPAGFVQYVHAHRTHRIIVLDTVTPGSDDASFCDRRAAWLADALAASDLPAVLALHHPPFLTGVPWMDPPSLAWTARLQAVVEAHPFTVAGLICGHIHRAIHTRAFGRPASSCPSTAHQVALGFNHQSPRLSLEAPGFQLHSLNDLDIVTYTASFDRFGLEFAPTEPSLEPPPRG